MKVVAVETVIGSTYRQPKKPFRIGGWRVKHWQAVLPPDGLDDPVWVKRAVDYWELQEKTFGIKLSPGTLSMNVITQDGQPDQIVVSTSAMVLDILPGHRTPDFKLPQVAAQQAASEAIN